MKTMKTMKTMRIMSLLLIIIFFSSCSKDNPTPLAYDSLYENGYFVTNEGNFGNGNASISFVDENGFVENDVFMSNNSFSLGDVVQSMSIINSNAYIVVNNSAKIEVASVDSMKSIASIDAGSPRYIAKVSDNKAYITDWSINGVHVLDLNSNNINSTINCGIGPEVIAVSNGYAYVCNVGGWGFDNTISIINISNDMVEKTLTVGDKPNSIVVDVSGAVWVLCGGYTEYNPTDWSIISQTAGSLVKIVNNNIELTYNFDVGYSPGDLVINDAGTDLYFSNNGVYSMSISDLQLPTMPVINRSFYALGYNDGYIYGTDVVDYVQQGWSFRYTSNGNIIDSIQVGIIPGGYCFN